MTDLPAGPGRSVAEPAMPAAPVDWKPLRSLPPGRAGLARAAALIRQARPAYTSVYLYGLEGETLVLRAFSGRPTAHTRIRVGDGICGRAVATRAVQVVADVAADPDYISCSLETRAECVVLVRRDGGIVGQIDIDSDVPNIFTAADVASLEEAAALIAPLF
jgi:L-methionine (R)-S-oxide reductase